MDFGKGFQATKKRMENPQIFQYLKTVKLKISRRRKKASSLFSPEKVLTKVTENENLPVIQNDRQLQM